MEIKADLSKELAIVRELIATNGRPVLTEEVLRQAASEGAASGRSVISAVHANGHVRASFVRANDAVAWTVASLESAGYWLNISVAPFVAQERRGR